MFAGLFLLFGVPLLFLDKESADQAIGMPLAGLAVLSLSGFAFSLAWHAWTTGQAKVQHFNYTRATQPYRFGATLVLILVAGTGTLITAFWVLFFK